MVFWDCYLNESNPQLYAYYLNRTYESLADINRTVVTEGEPVAVLSHGITRHRIRARLLAGSFSGRGRSSRPGKAPAWRFVEEDQLEGLALTGLTRKALRAGSRA